MDQYEQVTGMFRPIDPLSFVFNPALGAAAGTAVPEPTGVLLALCAIASGLALRRARR